MKARDSAGGQGSDAGKGISPGRQVTIYTP